MKQEAIIIQTTYHDLTSLNELSNRLIADSLAACTSIMQSVESCYRWNNKIEHITEHILEIKTIKKHQPKIETLINSYFDSECPQFVVLPILSMSEPYSKWFMDMIND